MAKSLNDFKQLCLLGEGAYSAVYKVVRLADREIYALKKVKLPSLSEKEKQNALNEVRLLASISDENIIAYKEAFFDDKTRCLCIVTEFADSGDLYQQIVKCQKERTHLREADIWRYMIGMCKGLKALHDLKILHRDLKCANIFLTQQSGGEVIAKLGDLNVSKVAKRGLCMTQTGTPYYASPEVWRDMPYDAKSDMWSLGCVCYEMVALRPPFRAEDMEGLYRKVLRGQYPRIPPHFSHDLSELIGILLQVNPRHRPSVDQLLQLPVMRRHDTSVAGVYSPRNDLLSTIKLPKNAIDFSAYLPKPQYHLKTHISSLNPQGTFGEDPRYLASGPGPAKEEMPPAPPRGIREVPIDGLQDSLDAYLKPSSVEHVSPEPATMEQNRQQPQMLPDSLDAYLQQKSLLPPVRQARNIEGQSFPPEPGTALEERQDTANGRETGRGGVGHASLRQELQAHQVERPQPPAYGAANRRGNERKPYSRYGQRGYSLGASGAAVAQTSTAKQTGGALRLPRIFSKAG